MKRRHWPRRPGSAVLTGMATVLLGTGMSGCESSQATPEAPCVRDKTPYTLDPATYADVGKAGSAEGNSRPFVTVFDEQHASRVGQVEIAMMLNRLHRDSKLRSLAVEGALVERPRPDLSWFATKPDERDRVGVALQLLRQGEVSAAEFAALVLPDFRLYPIERESEHGVTISDKASRSYTAYMVAIALKSVTAAQVKQADALLKQNKREEAIKFVIESDPWTKERYAQFTRKSPVVTTGEMQTLGTDLDRKATAIGADVGESRSDLQEARRFYDAATRRSGTMAALTADVAADHVNDCAPIAMDIGAAHTAEVAGRLKEKNLSYAVLSPASLAAGTAVGNGNLHLDAYDRKLKHQSVDPAGGVGALTDGRRKPEPAIGQKWFRTKAELAYATAAIVRTLAGGGKDGAPPNGIDQKTLGLGGPGSSISIDPGTIKVVPGVAANGTATKEVVFAATLLDQKKTVWVRAGTTPVNPDGPEEKKTLNDSLEVALGKMRDELKKEAPPAAEAAGPHVVEIVPGIKAAVTTSEESAAAVKLNPA